MAIAHTKTSASSPAPQGSGGARGPRPASSDASILDWMVGKASWAEATNIPVYLLNSRQAHPGQARPGPRSPEALGGPTCAILVKEARLLRHQRAKETVSKANVQSGKYEGKNASSDTCGKRANCR